MLKYKTINNYKFFLVIIGIAIFVFFSAYSLFHKKNIISSIATLNKEAASQDNATKQLTKKNNPKTDALERTNAQDDSIARDPLLAPFAMPSILATSFSDEICNITNYGAIGDGRTKNTQAFAEAITDCFSHGGGKVEVPRGVWLTGSIHLKSNIDLHLQEGAKILFSDDFNDYLPPVFSRFQGIELYNYSPLIYANDCQNIGITGEGELDGQAKKWHSLNAAEEVSTQNLQSGQTGATTPVSFEKLYLMARDNTPVKDRLFGDEDGALAPSFIQFINCQKILLEGITITNSPGWTIHPVYSSDLIIRNITVDTDGPNTDGIDIDSSKNILIENSQFDTGDDAISIKSGRDEDGRRIDKSSENIIIHDCEIDNAHAAFSIGSEMSGGVKNVFVYNLTAAYVAYGIRLKSTPGRGGTVENIWIKKININRATSDAIQIDLNYGSPVPGYDKRELPTIKDIFIEDFYCRRTKNAAELIGLDKSPLKNIKLKNIDISATNDLIETNLSSKSFENVSIKTDR